MPIGHGHVLPSLPTFDLRMAEEGANEHEDEAEAGGKGAGEHEDKAGR